MSGPNSNRQNLGVVLITGASSGIGEATALALDRRGFSVLAGVRREEDGERLRQKASGRLTPVLLDITDEAAIANVAELISTGAGKDGLKGVVNNAGIAVAGPLEFIALEDLRRQLEVNVVGQVAVTQAMLPLLRRARGRIVNIGSTSGRLATPLIGAYSAAKFAMVAVTDVLRLELRPWDIHVSIIEPGIIQTSMWKKSISAFDAFIASLPPEGQDLYGPSLVAARDYAKRIEGTPPEKVAQKVVHALTATRPRSRYIVGQNAVAELIAAALPTRIRNRIMSRVFPIGKSENQERHKSPAPSTAA